MAWTPICSLQRWDAINQRKRLLAVVAIGPSELNRQWNALPITNQMTLAAEFSPIGRIGTCPRPPKTARIELPSTIARDQSIFWERESQSRSTKWINCQIPASCQSRKRRQQVMPKIRTPVLGAASPKEHHCAIRIRCPQDTPGLPNAVCLL